MPHEIDPSVRIQMRTSIQKIVNCIWLFLKACNSIMRSRAVETIEYEIEELDHIFGILLFGAFVGLPSPPIHITLEIMPAMHKELQIMFEKMVTAYDPLGDLFSVLGIE
jgi:hypothetical protein